MRISISSAVKVKSDTDLNNKSLPPIAGGINSVFVKIDEKGIPLLRNKNSRVKNVHYIKSSMRYSNDNKMDAFITCGSNFSLGLDMKKLFCWLWLYTEPAVLQKTITRSLVEYYLDASARNVFYISCKLKIS